MVDRLRKDTRSTAWGRVGRSLAALVGACALLLPASGAPAATAGAGPPSPASPPAGGSKGPVTATLSNLKTLSRWAYPQAAAAAHQSPSAHSRVVGHLHFLTSDGQAEVYLALRSYTVGRRRGSRCRCPGVPTVSPDGCRQARSANCTSPTSTCASTARRCARPSTATGARSGARRGRRTAQPAHPRRPLLRDREADCHRRAVLRPLRAWHERVCADAQRMARRRRRRDPWNRRTAADPRSPLPRLHQAAQRRHHRACGR